MLKAQIYVGRQFSDHEDKCDHLGVFWFVLFILFTEIENINTNINTKKILVTRNTELCK